jgi:ferric-dicitrate binding protein FerR (iron transport regulator)
MNDRDIGGGMIDKDNRARDVTLEAAEWYTANRAGLDATQRLTFTRWLKFSPANVKEYLAISALARDLQGAPWAAGGSFGSIRRVYGRLREDLS